MQFFPRAIARTIERVAASFPALILTGPRQVGKTTILFKSVDATYISFDDPLLRESALQNPTGLLDTNAPPVIFDEIQYAPSLLPYLKMRIDQQEERGLYFLTGSQQFNLMKGVTESLAGRIAVLPMLGLSMRELRASEFFDPFIPNGTFISAAAAQNVEKANVWPLIFRGSLPGLWADQSLDRDIFYASYVKTYIERDVRDLAQVGDELAFLNFMRVIAANTGQILNLESLGRDVGISAPTAKRWLSVLMATGLVYLLQPYRTNRIKSIVKTPKVYFLETGLAAYLTRWPTWETLEAGAAAGAFFETFVISEIIKSYYNSGRELPLYYYRDAKKNEIDLVFEVGDTLYPAEIKKTTDPHYNDVGVFSKLDAITDKKRGEGVLVCQADNIVAIANNSKVLPVRYL
jgi:predicted AAA+ superfamily ATPase